jgi:soluble lytic murein transglycosylase-like protein
MLNYFAALSSHCSGKRPSSLAISRWRRFNVAQQHSFEGDDARPLLLDIPALAAPVQPQAGRQPAMAATTSAGQSRASRQAKAEAPAHLKARVAHHAAQHGVPFSIADAVVRVESRYNPRASNAGNFGLMQIRHQTARGVGYSGSAAGLLDAETNIRYGMVYLAMAYKAARGDTCGTVMRYQSGLGATQMNGANRAYCAKVRSYVAQG